MSAARSSRWEPEIKTLSEVALVGTARFADDARAALHGDLPVDDVLARAETSMSLERRVLLTAASRVAYERAGRALPTGIGPLPVSPAETHSTAAPSVTALIVELMSGHHAALLREALERLMRAERIVAPAVLPALLDVVDAQVREILPHVIGERGHWLGALDERAAWLRERAMDPHVVWREGAHAQRLAVLTERRRTSPAEAREWLAESWTQDKAEHRAEFVALFDVGLDATDAPFLEEALTDRSVYVRSAAARLLATIRDGEAARRMSARAEALLHYEPAAREVGARVKSAVGDTPAGTLAATPPQAFDSAWDRDGIYAKPPKGVGERAHWFTELLALVAPRHWEETFNASPSALIRAGVDSEWSQPLLLGWSRAAILHRSGEWIAALWDSLRQMPLDDIGPGERATRRLMREQLSRRLPPDAAEVRVLEVLAAPAADMRVELDALFDAIPAPWSADFGRRALRALARQMEATAGAEQQHVRGAWIEVLAATVMRLPQAVFGDALALEASVAGSESLYPAQQRKLEEFRQVVGLRQRIHQEIPL